MKNRVMTATEFKSHCLAVLDEVNETGDIVTITKRGRPVAVLQAAPKKPWRSLKNAWKGKLEFTCDIVNGNIWDGWTGDRENLP